MLNIEVVEFDEELAKLAEKLEIEAEGLTDEEIEAMKND